jgi:glycosyltransferase involved in cell wall biosynthesis
MTSSAEPAEPSGPEGESTDGALGSGWRARTYAVQQAVLPPGHVVVTCGVPFGGGGLGRHLKEIVDALERNGQERDYICNSNLPPPRRGEVPLAAMLRTPQARLSLGWRLWKTRVTFDARAARRLPAADSLMAFNRQAMAQFRTAREQGYGSLSLVTGSPHVRRVARQHGLAYDAYPLERSFGTFIVERYLAEYEQAERIFVASRYTWESFTEQGIPDERLALFPLTPDPRFRPPDRPQAPDTFNVVYAGSLSVAKGVPLLIDAFRRLPHRDLRLILIGNWKTRGMRRFMGEALAGDERIEVSPGDPLPHLHRAGVCVHPAYEDGFAYAPAEALACGVPVLVTADTGMKDLIEPGRTGEILATGDGAALSAAIDAAYRGEILRG